MHALLCQEHNGGELEVNLFPAQPVFLSKEFDEVFCSYWFCRADLKVIFLFQFICSQVRNLLWENDIMIIKHFSIFANYRILLICVGVISISLNYLLAWILF